MNRTYQECSEGLLTVLSQGQEHEKSNSKEVQRYVCLRMEQGDIISNNNFAHLKFLPRAKRHISEYEDGWGKKYLIICRILFEIQFITPGCQDATQRYCQVMAEVLIILPYQEGRQSKLLQPHKSWEGADVWQAWKHPQQQVRARGGCDITNDSHL